MKKERHCTYKSNIEAPSFNHRYGRKAINNTYSKCVFVAFVTPHEICKSYILFACETCPVVPYFFHIISWTTAPFLEKCSCARNVYIDFFYNVVWNIYLTLSTTVQAVQACNGAALTLPFNANWICSTDCRERLKYQTEW